MLFPVSPTIISKIIKLVQNKKPSEPESPEDCTLIYFILAFLHGKTEVTSVS
jgi:hypothetical protein